jgi:hypothetical protein
MGAAVIIVDHVGTTPTTQQLSDILNRTGIVRSTCFGCLTAVHIDTPTSLDNMNQSITGVLSDPRINFNLDMFTFDYPVSSHDSVISGVTDVQNASQDIVNDIASYGRTSLQTGGKPTMVVGFNVNNNDGIWNNANFQTLFDTITLQQQVLV